MMSIRKIWNKTAVVAAIIAGSLTGSSCFTISYSTTGAKIPDKAKTYSVQFVENHALNVEPGLSQQVTEALKDYMQSNSQLVLINGVGDIDFEAAITNYETNKPIAIVNGDEAAKNRFTITLKVKMTCDVEPDLDFESTFSRYEDYSAGDDFSSIKEELTKEILDLLMDEIFKKAFVKW
jgi:hypothetical protein